jgi:type IV pilus assembly protein PilC
MAIYRYTALSTDGEKIEGAVFVKNYVEAYSALRERQYHPVKIQKARLSSEKIETEELLTFFLHLDLQLKCKVRINDAIESFLNLQGSRALKSSLEAILLDLKNGLSIGDAFGKYGRAFNEVVVGLLKSGEKTGNLSDVIGNILKFLKMQSDWKNNVKRAIAYPIFIATVAVLVLFLSAGLLGPQIFSLIRDFGDGEIPLATQFVVDALPKIAAVTCCLLVAIFLTFFAASVNRNARAILMNAILNVPQIGTLITKICLWQFCKILHMALDAKLNFMQAIDLAVDAIEINRIKDELLIVKNYIADGHSISESFLGRRFISGALIAAVNIGEEGSDLSTSFLHMSDNQYSEILLDIKSLGQRLGVGITLFAGAVFVLILCGLFFPIYSYVEMAGA